ncbi:MAG: hypothetical protein V1747_04420 [Candidatus Omnitrophota bacterium]
MILFSSSYLFGKDFRTRLAYFLTIFAVWDIFYYVWLKLLLGWPRSIFDWDILFLIPLARATNQIISEARQLKIILRLKQYKRIINRAKDKSGVETMSFNI